MIFVLIFSKIIEMTKKANEKLEESSNNARIYDKINRDNNTGGIIQSIQTLGSSIGSTLESTIENTIGIGSTIGSTIGNTIGSIFSNDSSKSKMSVSDTPLQGYFENIEKGIYIYIFFIFKKYIYNINLV